MESLMDILRPGGKNGKAASVYFVGIKGTGVCALAELFKNSEVNVAGSDISEVFYTDAILKEMGIPYHEFDPARITNDLDLVIHSPAYNEKNNGDLAEAVKKSIPILSYPEALGGYSSFFDSTGVAGVHGKTTTTAMCGCLTRTLNIPAQTLAGSAVSSFNGRSTLRLGDKYFIAETCEYRGHFLAFRPKRIILTAVESDHQDFFPTYESIRNCFVEYCRLIPPGGELIYCADDPGASEVAGIINNDNKGIVTVPYGFTASGDYKICSYRVEGGRTFFSVSAFQSNNSSGPLEFCLRVPGRHQVLNATAALALASVFVAKEFNGWNGQSLLAAWSGLEEFSGSKRRSEVVGIAGGIIFMDDYGHHPTEIKTTLEGLRGFYPERRIVVSFMSHTYTRTAALLDDFASSLNIADVLFLHKIYASARENFNGKIEGKNIYEKVEALRSKAALRNGTNGLFYVDEPPEAFEPLVELLKPGDLFLTLGAGNNWPLAFRLFNHFNEIKENSI